MERVTVAELKAKLSHYLREVRQGRSFTVVSRDIPVATLGPHEPLDADDLQVIEATGDPADWGRVHLPPLDASIDVVALLRADRDERDALLDAILRESVRPRNDAERGPRLDVEERKTQCGEGGSKEES